jgi:2,3-bisphosphoglycerate-independent phosphoglycerate mutase
MPHEYIKPLLNQSTKKIVLLVLDGLGGLPIKLGGPTELETAKTPNLDQLAKEGSLGQTIPIRLGITPGSGPAHLALFGYDPLVYDIGRGALEVSGVGMHVGPGDIAARGNFCSLDKDGIITDRRAGRISSENSGPLVDLLKKIKVPGVTFEVNLVKEHRFALIMRGDQLHPGLADTDPQVTGKPPLPVTPTDPKAERTAKLVQTWVSEAERILGDQPQANGLTLRGFATDPGLPSYQKVYGLRAACVAVYPMYKGVSKLVGMDVIPFSGEKPDDEFHTVAGIWNDYDFFFIHIKKTDSMGEDGNFEGKVKIIEEVDETLPILLALEPDVLVVTGDHSTPSKLRAHSWHPVPLLLWAPESHLPDAQETFGERACAVGGLGTFPAQELMALTLAHALRMNKFGA